MTEPTQEWCFIAPANTDSFGYRRGTCVFWPESAVDGATPRLLQADCVGIARALTRAAPEAPVARGKG
jgi:hypothetical protein